VIRLNRRAAPSELTEELVHELTEKYKENRKASVWDKPFIKKALLELSHGKCCYCETKLGEESKYLTVDHFHHKNDYPDEVVVWENLFPACSRCNSKKGTHNTYRYPVINPTVDDPKEFLFFYNYNYKSRDQNELGKTTICTLGLNDTEKSVYPRTKIGEAIERKLDEIYDKVQKYVPTDGDVRGKNKIIDSINDMLSLALPSKEYSALAATVILGDPDYAAIKSKMEEYDLWDEMLERLETHAKNICLLQEPTAVRNASSS